MLFALSALTRTIPLYLPVLIGCAWISYRVGRGLVLALVDNLRSCPALQNRWRVTAECRLAAPLVVPLLLPFSRKGRVGLFDLAAVLAGFALCEAVFVEPVGLRSIGGAVLAVLAACLSTRLGARLCRPLLRRGWALLNRLDIRSARQADHGPARIAIR